MNDDAKEVWLVSGLSVYTHTVCFLCVMVSHLKAALLDVVKLQAERLYAAYDSPLVANQTDPDTPDVAGGGEKIYSLELIVS